MLALLATLQFQLQAPPIATTAVDSLPIVTLPEALRQATGLDPNYVAAIGQVTNAAWARRSAFSVFILPSITLNTEAARSNPLSFNFVTFQAARTQVTSQVTAKYDLFLGGQKFAELSRSGAALEAAHAGELAARFTAAQVTESTYYAVLADAELLRVARERVQRAEQQLAVGRARVVSGAAVQTDSLQLRLELSQAREELLRQEFALRVSRLTLGSRVGAGGPVEAAPLDSVLPTGLPLTLDAAVEEAALRGPDYRRARATERAAAASYRWRLGSYLPHATLTGTGIAFDKRFYPTSRKFTQLTLAVSFPVWDNFQRENALSQARVNRDVARATRETLERSVRRDVTAAYDGFTTARTVADISAGGVAVARENFRVQQSRYRAGATPILELREAQLRLADAEADLGQARYATRLTLAGLEAILGRRLFAEQEQR